MGRGAWQVTVQRDHKESDLSGLLSTRARARKHTHTHTHTHTPQALCWGHHSMEFSQDSCEMNAYQSFFTDEKAQAQGG